MMFKWVPECLSPAFLKSAKQIPISKLENFLVFFYKIEKGKSNVIKITSLDGPCAGLTRQHK